VTAAAAHHEGREAAAVEEHDRLIARGQRLGQRGEERLRDQIGVGAERAQVDDRDLGQRPAGGPCHQRHQLVAPGGRRGVRLEAGRGRAEHAHRAGALRPHQRDVAAVVAHALVLLERAVVLLVDHDDAEVVHRREHRRARAHRDARDAALEPGPLAEPLALGQPRVQDRHLVAEAGAEPRRELRRQRDLRHQHDGALAPGSQRADRVEVHLGLARAGDAQPR
jgi:hypothetical protein